MTREYKKKSLAGRMGRGFDKWRKTSATFSLFISLALFLNLSGKYRKRGEPLFCPKTPMPFLPLFSISAREGTLEQRLNALGLVHPFS
ncbi:hypothetical protein LIER_17318 [Lithospermum erythrorhizon]|uniref:Uncharacterized protein n=1 Tax=Lithospermum erythrorhizon TaxID=34254 RepID=A0AAV3Q9U5_LITER